MPHDPLAVVLRQIRDGEFDDHLKQLDDVLHERFHNRDAAWRQKNWFGVEQQPPYGLIGSNDTDHDSRGNPL